MLARGRINIKNETNELNIFQTIAFLIRERKQKQKQTFIINLDSPCLHFFYLHKKKFGPGSVLGS